MLRDDAALTAVMAPLPGSFSTRPLAAVEVRRIGLRLRRGLARLTFAPEGPGVVVADVRSSRDLDAVPDVVLAPGSVPVLQRVPFRCR